MLFVDADGQTACPLVGCAAGRFRVEDGRVYTNQGFELQITEQGIQVGPQRLANDPITVRIPPASASYLEAEATKLREARRELSKDAYRRARARLQTLERPRTLAQAPVQEVISAPLGDNRAVRLEDFARWVRQLDYAPVTKTVASADPDRPFTVARPVAVPLTLKDKGPDK